MKSKITLLLLIISVSIAEIMGQPCGEPFEYTMNYSKLCKGHQLEFSITNQAGLDFAEWFWGDGTNNTTSNTPHTIQKTYLESGYYTVKVKRHFENGCIDSVLQDTVIYDIPSIAGIRLSPSAECLPHTESVVIVAEEPVDPAINFSMNFIEDMLYGFDIENINDTIDYTYNHTSCGKDVTISGELLCEDCYLIVIIAENQCGPSLSIAAPVEVNVFGPPTVDFEIYDSLVVYEEGIYNICKIQTLDYINTGGVGAGTDCQANDTLTWTFFDRHTNEIVGEIETFCNSNNCDSVWEYTLPHPGLYDVTLTQTNSCGSSTVTKQLYIRDLPAVEFDLTPMVDCFPVEISFQNTSADDLLKYEWDFIGDSSNIVTDTALLAHNYLYTEEGEYNVILRGYDKYCVNEKDTIINLVTICEDLYVPSAFIPDSYDDKFRTFRPVAQNLLEYKIEIFNLRGQLLWKSEEIHNKMPAEGWDGTFNEMPCPAGTYIWKIEAVLDDGYSENGTQWKGQKENGKKMTTGIFSLIR